MQRTQHALVDTHTLLCGYGTPVHLCFDSAGATNNRSDRIAQALSASAESIGAAVSGRSDATAAAQKSKAFALLAGREGTSASEFGGK